MSAAKAKPRSQPRPEFMQLQDAFAAHLRHPERHAPPAGLEDRRLAVYRELFFNNVLGGVSSAFPVLRKLIPEAHWAALVREFYDAHNAHTPLFHQLAKEFLDWLSERAGSVQDEPAYVPELAHYEWVELALSLDEHEPPPPLAADADLLASQLVKNSLAWPLVYAFDVHRIGPDYQPASAPPAPTCLVVYRNAEDAVKFMEINPITARLLELLEERPGATGKALLTAIAAELGHPKPKQVIAEGRTLLRLLADRGIIGAA